MKSKHFDQKVWHPTNGNAAKFPSCCWTSISQTWARRNRQTCISMSLSFIFQTCTCEPKSIVHSIWICVIFQTLLHKPSSHTSWRRFMFWCVFGGSKINIEAQKEWLDVGRIFPEAHWLSSLHTSGISKQSILIHFDIKSKLILWWSSKYSTKKWCHTSPTWEKPPKKNPGFFAFCSSRVQKIILVLPSTPTVHAFRSNPRCWTCGCIRCVASDDGSYSNANVVPEPPESRKIPWLVGLYRGWQTTQWYRDYFINHDKDPY